MSTPGLVTIRKDGQVVMKLAAGCSGMYKGAVADAIRELNRVPTFDEAKKIAGAADFGCENCFVVMDGEDIFWPEEDGTPPEHFRSTFSDPSRNPHWMFGDSVELEIVEF